MRPFSKLKNIALAFVSLVSTLLSLLTCKLHFKCTNLQTQAVFVLPLADLITVQGIKFTVYACTCILEISTGLHHCLFVC